MLLILVASGHIWHIFENLQANWLKLLAVAAGIIINIISFSLWHVIFSLSSHPSLPATLAIGNPLLWVPFLDPEYSFSQDRVPCLSCCLVLYRNRAERFLGAWHWMVDIVQPWTKKSFGGLVRTLTNLKRNPDWSVYRALVCERCCFMDGHEKTVVEMCGGAQWCPESRKGGRHGGSGVGDA